MDCKFSKCPRIWTHYFAFSLISESTTSASQGGVAFEVPHRTRTRSKFSVLSSNLASKTEQRRRQTEDIRNRRCDLEELRDNIAEQMGITASAVMDDTARERLLSGLQTAYEDAVRNLQALGRRGIPATRGAERAQPSATAARAPDAEETEDQPPPTSEPTPLVMPVFRMPVVEDLDPEEDVSGERCCPASSS